MTIRGEVVFPGTYPIRRGETTVVAARARGRAHGSRVPGGQRIHARRDCRSASASSSKCSRSASSAILPRSPSRTRMPSETITTGQSLITNCAMRWRRGGWSSASMHLVAGDERRRRRAQGRRSADRARRAPRGDACSARCSTRRRTCIERGLEPRRVHQRERRADASAPTRSASTSCERTAKSWRIRVRAGSRETAASDIRPGDSIVVPLDVDQPLARWSAITQIIYNLAIAAAAVNSF